MPRVRVTVAVLGDLGRSPRMLYHARSLADSDADVTLVGHVERRLPADVRRHPHIRVHRLRPPAVPRRHALPRPLFVAVALWNLVRQTLALFVALRWRTPPPAVLLVQSPPGPSTLAAALAAARARGARLVVDWHNDGAAVLALTIGARHPAVRLVAAAERALGRRAGAHLCVTRALADALATRGIAGAIVLPDRPAAAFVPTPPAERAPLLARLTVPLADGAALVVCPCGWTADDDLDLLLAAAARYDADRGRPLTVLLTGDGPRRVAFETRLAGLRFERVRIRTLWLEPDDYPRVVGAADLGLSLHRSASGLDLPMKIVDCLGAGVPVLALDYGPSLAELVRPDENGLLFRTAGELAERLAEAVAPGRLARLRARAAAAAMPRWDETWAAAARPVLLP
jgi:beta-1,4-mannosyltransferase